MLVAAVRRDGGLRARDDPRRDARRAHRAGRGGRHLPAGVRHHPRRVPARAGRRRRRDHVGAGRRRRRRSASCSPARSSTTSPTTGCSGCRWSRWSSPTVAIHLFVPESPIRVPGKVNWTGAALMSLGLGLVLIAVSETPTWGWLSAEDASACSRPAPSSWSLWVRSETRSDRAARRHADDAHPRRLDDERRRRCCSASACTRRSSCCRSTSRRRRAAGYGFGASVTGAGLFLLPSTLAMLVAGAQTGPAREAVRLEAAAARRRAGSPPRSYVAARGGPRRALGDLPRRAPARRRHRPGLRVDGQPDHRERRPRARPASPPA